MADAKGPSDIAKVQATMAKSLLAQQALIKADSGNEIAMRKVIALKSDIAAIERIAKRIDGGYYDATK